MRFLVVFVFFILSLSCWGDIEDRLKKVENKTFSARMPGIDYIYMINLDQRPEKWTASLNQLARYGISPYRFSAVNGWELSIDDINDVGVKLALEMRNGWMGTCYHTFEPSHEIIQIPGQTYFGHCLSRGAIGIALSHISILQDAFDSGYETIWVMEDDIEVIRDPRILTDLIDRLDQAVGKDNWDILFTDRDIRNRDSYYVPTYYAGKRPDYESTNHFDERTVVTNDFIKIGARSGAHSMIIRKSGIKKLFLFFATHNIFLPYDMDFILPQGIRMYTVRDDVVSNLPHASSDNGGPNYLTGHSK
jgi:GR25 family glycosyltransferase involved in LPS biosynthesis